MLAAMARRAGTGGRVWSSERGELCTRCEKPLDRCACPAPDAPRGDGVARVGRETKGRKGAGVTIVRGLALTPADLKALDKALKQRCGAGGSVEDGAIVIQGEHRDTIVAELENRGHKAKRAGG